MMNASGVTTSGLRLAGACGDVPLTRADRDPPRCLSRRDGASLAFASRLPDGSRRAPKAPLGSKSDREAFPARPAETTRAVAEGPGFFPAAGAARARASRSRSQSAAFACREVRDALRCIARRRDPEPCTPEADTGGFRGALSWTID